MHHLIATVTAELHESFANHQRPRQLRRSFVLFEIGLCCVACLFIQLANAVTALHRCLQADAESIVAATGLLKWPIAVAGEWLQKQTQEYFRCPVGSLAVAHPGDEAAAHPGGKAAARPGGRAAALLGNRAAKKPTCRYGKVRLNETTVHLP